ncbi:MAG: hypothetical protein A2958_02435 [Candidatus Levybacteria bacterium RIFCSPLOWO2_01_FULL_38_13]|nr:MAG: hypothetical protein A2958_02435 [Candidatus Levybacteria bacterium RIFCSPLOWO2_01_FULL_38_13]
MRRLIISVLILVVILFGLSALVNKFSDINLPKSEVQPEKVKIVKEESVAIDVVKRVGPSVVTVVESSQRSFGFGSFDVPDTEERNIGSGFIISENGLIVTNKHVVSDKEATYQIVTSDDKKYSVQRIFRDPLNDIAILKVNFSDNPGTRLKSVELGDSSKLEVGQFVIAIGTALGKFRNTVTTGVVSGLGRGITAGSEFEGFVERLDNVIQISAAVNPGNSGGPLVNSAGQVIGVNTAIARGGQNIGFALPINTVKEAVSNFNEHGEIVRPYLGVVYRIVTRDVALLNEVPQGALVQEVIEGSGADKVGVRQGDIITTVEGKKIEEINDLADTIKDKKVGDRLTLVIWRDGKTQEVRATLSSAPNN